MSQGQAKKVNNHLFTPGGKHRMTELGFEFCFEGYLGNEAQGYWRKRGSNVRVQRVKTHTEGLLWELSVPGHPLLTFRHPDEGQILDVLEALSDSPAALQATASETPPP